MASFSPIDPPGPIALVTGATSGIGEATARLLAEKGYHLIVTGRRKERLQSLRTSLHSKTGRNILCLCFDIRSHEAVQSALTSLPDNWKNIDVLVNNAGLAAGLDPIHEGQLQHWEQMIDTNIKGLLYITRQMAPLMKEKKKGHIINIGSVAGKEVYLKGNVYCATKHAVDALNKAMRIDLMPYNIRVTSINPGAAETEFSIVRFDGDSEKARRVYEGFTPLSAQDIAECVWFALSRPPHVTINDMVVMPTAQASSAHLHRNSATHERK